MAEEKKRSLFRKKSEDYINSPEKLDYYLHVTTPGIWAILLAVIIFLIGACVWGATATLETSVSVAVVSDNGKVTAYIPETALDAVVKSRTATINGRRVTLEPDTPDLKTVTDETSIYVRKAGNLQIGDIVYEIPIKESLADGVYSARVVTEVVSPVSLLMN
jgi:hypothetical protein